MLVESHLVVDIYHSRLALYQSLSRAQEPQVPQVSSPQLNLECVMYHEKVQSRQVWQNLLIVV